MWRILNNIFRYLSVEFNATEESEEGQQGDERESGEEDRSAKPSGIETGFDLLRFGFDFRFRNKVGLSRGFRSLLDH